MPDDGPGSSKALSPSPSLAVGFAGTPEFAKVALDHLIKAGYEVPLVLTQPDRPAGRGMKLKPSPVKELALVHGIQVLQPVSLRKGEEAQEALNALLTANDGQPLDVLVVAAYGLILPQNVLDAPKYGCLNIHGSLLPRWRGAAPIHRAVEAGDAETGVCIMQMEAGLDTGPVRLTRKLPISDKDTTASLHDKLADLGGSALLEALGKLESGDLPIEPQPEVGVTYAEKILKSEGPIDWLASADVLQRRLRAFDPFPGCTASIGDVTYKCFDPEVLDSSKMLGQPGQVLEVSPRGLDIQTGHGILRIKSMQKPGSKRGPALQVASTSGIEPGQLFSVQP